MTMKQMAAPLCPIRRFKPDVQAGKYVLEGLELSMVHQWVTGSGGCGRRPEGDAPRSGVNGVGQAFQPDIRRVRLEGLTNTGFG